MRPNLALKGQNCNTGEVGRIVGGLKSNTKFVPMPELEAPSNLARTANDIEASPLLKHGPLELKPNVLLTATYQEIPNTNQELSE